MLYEAAGTGGVLQRENGGGRRHRSAGDLLMNADNLVVGLRDPAGQISGASGQFLRQSPRDGDLLSRLVTGLGTPPRIQGGSVSPDRSTSA